MNKKLTLAIVALLGFSTACSSVKNAPATGKQTHEVDSTLQRRIIVMYGVRTPNNALPTDKMLQRAPETKPQQDSPASHVDPVTERPSDEDVPARPAQKPTPAKQ